MKIDRAIEDICEAEVTLAEELRRVGERHAAESDVYHVTRLLSMRCATQVDRLRPHASHYGASDLASPAEESAPIERARRMSSELLGKHGDAGALLLEDLRRLYLSAHGAELAWVELHQAARAARDGELEATAKRGCEEAERRWKWIRTKVKESSPQVLVAG
jgi:hypothetical protein